ncbi:MAG: hypothetical protein J5814_09710 [Bacteroidaceae bacterium]|nr:hypothetical protein [Bacteroidaceae bacterium]
MKRLFITILIALTAISVSRAQYVSNPSYNELKQSYNPKEYVRQPTDPYNVSWYGVSSFFLPGIGQLLSGETWRGLAFMGGEAVLLSIIRDAALHIEDIAVTDDKGFLTGITDEAAGKRHMIVLLSALGADLGLSIWSCINAKKVVKVKNMYYQDLMGRKTALEMNLAPTLSVASAHSGALTPTAGLSLQLRF